MFIPVKHGTAGHGRARFHRWDSMFTPSRSMVLEMHLAYAFDSTKRQRVAQISI